MAIAILSIFFQLVYILGSLPYVNFSKNAFIDGALFVGGIDRFMKDFPLASWMFVGIESLIMASGEAIEPKKSVPAGQLLSIGTVFLLSIGTLLVAVSLPPGIASLAEQPYALSQGFKTMFALSHAEVAPLSMPAVFGTALGFIYAYSKLLAALARSKLIPSFLAHKSRFGSPYLVIWAGSTISYCISLLTLFVPLVSANLYNVCILCGFTTYLAQCSGFIYFRLKFPMMPRGFVSPLGLAGAVFSMAVWLMGIISIIFLQSDKNFSLLVCAAFFIACNFYYNFYAQAGQTFSEEERNFMFAAHCVSYSFMSRSNDDPQAQAQVSSYNSSMVLTEMNSQRPSMKLDHDSEIFETRVRTESLVQE